MTTFRMGCAVCRLLLTILITSSRHNLFRRQTGVCEFPFKAVDFGLGNFYFEGNDGGVVVVAIVARVVSSRHLSRR